MRFELRCVAVGLLMLTACGSDADDTSSTTSGTGGGGVGGGGAGVPDPTPISAKAAVKRKNGARMVGDLAQALELSPDELCRELGEQACADVHSIALGGVSAYSAGVFEPLETSTATGPIAVDRLVLSACQTRAWRDFDDAKEAVLFGALPVVDGRFDPDAEVVATVVADLYHRAHLREPKPAEVSHLRELYRQIEAAGATAPARDWSALSCYAVFTTLEAVFY